MPTPDITTLTSDLRALGGQRVWSLMISLFGDLAQGEGDEIDGPVLSAIMAALLVKPEAARVALHRLRKDGWLTSAKSGRISRHSLTSKGRRESAAASPRIYAQPYEGPRDWQLVMLETSEGELQAEMAVTGFRQIVPRVFIGPAAYEAPKGALALSGQTAPSWLMAQLLPEDVAQEYAKLHQSLSMLSTMLPASEDLSALDIAVLRCLIVHNWRRLVLKHPAPPRALIAENSALHQCHVIVADLLAGFPRPALRSIAQEQANP